MPESGVLVACRKRSIFEYSIWRGRKANRGYNHVQRRVLAKPWLTNTQYITHVWHTSNKRTILSFLHRTVQFTTMVARPPKVRATSCGVTTAKLVAREFVCKSTLSGYLKKPERRLSLSAVCRIHSFSRLKRQLPSPLRLGRSKVQSNSCILLQDFQASLQSNRNFVQNFIFKHIMEAFSRV